MNEWSYRLRDGELEWREVEGEIVALDLRASTYLSVNKAGTALWPHLTAGASRDELVAALISRYDVDADAAARDVDAFVQALEAKGLLAP
jgi:coenzyme PQQ synthesis protein D (PqqD)